MNLTHSTKLSCFLLIILLYLPCIERVTADDKPFQRVLVLSGGGFNYVTFLGMLAGLNESNWKPDTVIGTCGAGMALAIINRFPNLEDQKIFAFSKEHYELLKQVRVNYPVCTGNIMIPRYAKLSRDIGNNIHLNTYPDPWNYFITTAPSTITNDTLSVPFTFGSQRTRVVMIGTKVLFSKEDQGKKRTDSPAFRQVFVTDSDTGRSLENFRSIFFKEQRVSHIDEQTEVVTNRLLLEGARICMSDPYYMQPAQYGDTTYLGGVLNHYPIEVANHLGEEVIMTYQSPFSVEENLIGKSVFGIDMIKRLDQVNREEVFRWIRYNDTKALHESFGIKPEIDGKKAALQKLQAMVGKLKRPTTEEGWKDLSCVTLTLPEDYEVFRKQMRQLWNSGKERGIEAMRAKRNGRSHLPNQPNAELFVPDNPLENTPGHR